VHSNWFSVRVNHRFKVDLLEVEDGVFFKTAALLVGVTRNVVNNLVVCCLADGRTVSSD